jgi:hypothetical protein
MVFCLSLYRARRVDTGRLGIGGRFLRPQILRHDPRQHESLHTWGAILGPYAAGAVYDRTESYAIVFSAITVALVISAALTALLIKPWEKGRQENQT